MSRRSLEGFGIGYFYFRHDDRTQQDAHHVVASLLKQLLIQLGTLPPDLIRIYNEENKGNPGIDTEILDLLFSCSLQFASTWIVFDGLDECTSQQQTAIISLTTQFCSADKAMRVLLTSQPQLLQLVEEVQPAMCQEISATTEDLTTFVMTKLACRYPELEEMIVESILDDIDGMYALTAPLNFLIG
jgi:hypothetical protein